MDQTEFSRHYLGTFTRRRHRDDSDSLDKEELSSLINLMFRFSQSTGSNFKIEEYDDMVFILTDVNKLSQNDRRSCQREKTCRGFE